MADPGTLILLSTIAGVAGEGVNMIEGYQQGKYESRVAGSNAQIALQNARNARLSAAANEETQRREARKALGSSAAAISQAGIGGPAYGSAGAALKQSSAEAELDALNIRYGGELEATGHQQEAANWFAEQRAAKRRAKGAVVSGMIGAGTKALTGAANYRAYQASQQPVLNRGMKPPTAHGSKKGLVGYQVRG